MDSITTGSDILDVGGGVHWWTTMSYITVTLTPVAVFIMCVIHIVMSPTFLVVCRGGGGGGCGGSDFGTFHGSQNGFQLQNDGWHFGPALAFDFRRLIKRRADPMSYFRLRCQW